MIILRPKNVIFERFWIFPKFHFPACSTLIIVQLILNVCHDEKYKVKDSLIEQKSENILKPQLLFQWQHDKQYRY